jgi:hypothetical protein
MMVQLLKNIYTFLSENSRLLNNMPTTIPIFFSHVSIFFTTFERIYTYTNILRVIVSE